MQLQAWESTVKQIIDELKKNPREAMQRRTIDRWRRTLEAEPMRLQPFQIDQVMREVRRRLRFDSGS